MKKLEVNHQTLNDKLVINGISLQKCHKVQKYIFIKILSIQKILKNKQLHHDFLFSMIKTS